MEDLQQFRGLHWKNTRFGIAMNSETQRFVSTSVDMARNQHQPGPDFDTNPYLHLNVLANAATASEPYAYEAEAVDLTKPSTSTCSDSDSNSSPSGTTLTPERHEFPVTSAREWPQLQDHEEITMESENFIMIDEDAVARQNHYIESLSQLQRNFQLNIPAIYEALCCNKMQDVYQMLTGREADPIHVSTQTVQNEPDVAVAPAPVAVSDNGRTKLYFSEETQVYEEDLPKLTQANPEAARNYASELEPDFALFRTNYFNVNLNPSVLAPLRTDVSNVRPSLSVDEANNDEEMPAEAGIVQDTETSLLYMVNRRSKRAVILKDVNTGEQIVLTGDFHWEHIKDCLRVAMACVCQMDEIR